MDVIDVESRLRDLGRLPVAPAPTLGQLAERGARRRSRRRAAGMAAAAISAMVLVGLLPRLPGEETKVRTVAEPEVTGPTTTLSAEDALAAWDRVMVGELEAFALRPSDETFGDLSLAPWVMLGIDGRTVAVKAREDLRDPTVWVVEGHSVLDTLAAGGDYVLERYTHETCVGEENPAPPEMTGYRRLSIHPADLKDETCLNWYSVDLFFSDGRIVGISLTLWEY